ncbi:hypothetical protein [Moorena sp. SIO4E2]|nr:hypothetical protein [Moorena sp. SIO4E2]
MIIILLCLTVEGWKTQLKLKKVTVGNSETEIQKVLKPLETYL